MVQKESSRKLKSNNCFNGVSMAAEEEAAGGEIYNLP